MKRDAIIGSVTIRTEGRHTMRRGLVLFMLIVAVDLTMYKQACAQTESNVLTNHNDNNRSGTTLNEKILTVHNVNDKQFGRLFTLTVDGCVFAQPLYVSGLNI